MYHSHYQQYAHMKNKYSICSYNMHILNLLASYANVFTFEHSSCITWPNSWKYVSTSWCWRREGHPFLGLVKLATIAATGSLRFPSGPLQPGVSPIQAACPYFPSLVGDGLYINYYKHTWSIRLWSRLYTFCTLDASPSKTDQSPPQFYSRVLKRA